MEVKKQNLSSKAREKPCLQRSKYKQKQQQKQNLKRKKAMVYKLGVGENAQVL